MRATGITRRIDELGRIVLPVELRRTMGIGDKGQIDIYVEGNSIILQPSGQTCVFCGNAKSLIKHKGSMVCKACVRDLIKYKSGG